jgi:hypothetical protein
VRSLPTEAHGIPRTDYLANVNDCLDLDNKKLVLKLYPRLCYSVSQPLSRKRDGDVIAFTEFHAR